MGGQEDHAMGKTAEDINQQGPLSLLLLFPKMLLFFLCSYLNLMERLDLNSPFWWATFKPVLQIELIVMSLSLSPVYFWKLFSSYEPPVSILPKDMQKKPSHKPASLNNMQAHQTKINI